MSKSVKQTLSAVPVGYLFADDCFFYLSDEGMREAESMQARLNGMRVEFDPNSPAFKLDVEAFGEPHIVLAVAKQANEARVSTRTTDGKRFVFEADTVVLHAPDRTRFDQQLQWVRDQRDHASKEAQRLNQAKASRSKKKDKPTEVELKTLVAAQ